MGVDVNLYAVVPHEPANLDTAEETFFRRSRVADRYEKDGTVHWRSLEFAAADEWSPPRVVANLTCRYYGPGYERGDWPGIYGAIRLLGALVPGVSIHYGADHDVSAPEVTEAWMAEMWDHYLGPDGSAYFDRRR